MVRNEFKNVYEQARRTRAVARGFINYLKKYGKRKATNREPYNLSSYVLCKYFLLLFFASFASLREPLAPGGT